MQPLLDSPAADAAWPQSQLHGRPMRVLMLTDCFPKPTNLRLGVWALEQARGLARAGAAVRVVSPTPWLPGVLAIHPKVKRMTDCPAVHDWGELMAEYPRWPYYNLGGSAKLLQKHPAPVLAFAQTFLHGALRRTIESWKPDVVFVHHTVPSGPVAVWIKATFGIPFVTMDLDFGSVEDARIHGSRRKVFAATARQAHTATGAARKISDSMREQFPARSNVPLYMGTREIAPAIRAVPRPPELALKEVVFSAAGFFERKGIPELIQAFAIVAKKRPGAILRIGGEGRCKPQIDAAIAESGVADRIQLLGALPHEQVIQEMVWADLFMLIGWAEPFATVYLEAMSAGRPIICCNDGGICEVMRDGVQGRAVPPHDVPAAAAALEQLMGDDALRQRMGRAAHELFQQRLNITATARETLAILHGAAISNSAQSTG
jgi:glycosyltransferase involved in cell wall biosynthesis